MRGAKHTGNRHETIFDLDDGGTPDPDLIRDLRMKKARQDFTFFHCSDIHYDFLLPDLKKTGLINSMNAMPGAISWPDGTALAEPVGVVCTGDLTHHVYMPPEQTEWDLFEAGFIDTLNYPVFECPGNHDRWYAYDRILERHGGLEWYKWKWGDTMFFCTGNVPTGDVLDWIHGELEALQGAPAVICQHVGMSAFSQDPASQGWQSDTDIENYRQAIEGFNVLGIFHGHWHNVNYETHWGYDWNNGGHTYLEPPPFHDEFHIVRVTAATFTVGLYRATFDATGEWTGGTWQRVVSKAI